MSQISQITQSDIKKIARLARIEVAADESENLAKKVGNIISWVEQLNEVDTSKTEALTTVCNTNFSENLRFAEDKISDGNIAEDVLRNATNPVYGYFSVPKVIE